MTTLIECPGCTRHVRVEDSRCPFCGRSSTTAAPSRVLALVLPLTLMACTGSDPAQPTPDSKTAPQPDPPPVMTAPPPDDPIVAPPEPTPTPDDAKVDPVQPSGPADDGAVVDDPASPVIDHPPTKYGGPPRPSDDPLAVPPTPDAERPARKYGAPPPPEPRPAKKYGAPPRPSDDPLG